MCLHLFFLFLFTVSGSNSSLSYPGLEGGVPGSPEHRTASVNTFFGVEEVVDRDDGDGGSTLKGDVPCTTAATENEREPSSPCPQYEQEFERFVTASPNHHHHHHHRSSSRGSPHDDGLKACSQLGIMQPLEQLHTANLAIGIKLELFFEAIFRKWGTFVARNPWSIITASLIVSFYLASGVYFNFQVTTDPVDLWVPLGSEARSDMEYFNNKFWKFYRIEQLLIEPKNIDAFSGRDYSAGGNSGGNESYRHFGPVFNQTFLLESFDLYQRILAIEAVDPETGRPVKLEDICLKPLGGHCATQSLFTYFKENVSEIASRDYLKQVQDCVE